MTTVKAGDNVTVPVPNVARGRADPRNPIGVLLDISDTDVYTIAVKGEILNRKYSRNQFDLCATALYSHDDVVTVKLFHSVRLYNLNQNVVIMYKEMSDKQM